MARASNAPDTADGAAPAGRGGPKYRASWLLLLAMPLLVPITTLNVTWLDAATALTGDPLRAPKACLVALLLLGASIGWGFGVLRRAGKLRWTREMWLIVAFLGVAALSAAFGLNWSTALFGSYQYRQGLVMMLVLSAVVFLTMQLVTSPARARSLAAAVVLGGVPVALYGLLQATGHDPATWGAPAWATARGFSTLGNPDNYAGYLVLPFTLAAGLALTERRAELRLAWWFSLAATAAALLIAQTRGAWVGAVVAVLVIVAFLVRGRVRVQAADWVVIGLAVVILLGVGYAARDSLSSRISEMLTGEAAAGAGRPALWASGVRAVAQHPLLGVGPDSYRFAHYLARKPTEHAPLGGTRTLVDDAHSLPLMIAGTTGVPSLLIAAAFLLLAAGPALRATWRRDIGPDRLLFAAWLAAIAGYLGYLTFGPSAISSNLVLAMAFGVVLGTRARGLDGAGRGLTVGVVSALVVLALVASVTSIMTLGGDYYYARAVFRDGDPLERIDTAVRWSPWSWEYRSYRVGLLRDRALAATGDAAQPAVDAATGAYRDLIAFAPAEELTYSDYADMLLSLQPEDPKHAEEALAVAKKGFGVYPASLDARVLAGEACLRLGRYEEAVDVLAGYWNADPGYIHAALLYGDALLELSRPSEAERVAVWLDKHAPGDSDVVDFKSRLARIQGSGQ